jgi:peroxiredoxin
MAMNGFRLGTVVTKGRAARLAALGILGLSLVLGRTMPGRGDRGGAGGPTGRGIGREVADFRLVDVRTGRPVALADFANSRAVVLAFSGVDCPLGNLAMPRLVRLAEAYRGRGVAVLALNANAHDTAEQVVANAREHGVGFPVLKDVGNAVADRLQVERIGEVLVLDGHRRLRYRGAIDDRDSLRGRKGEASHNYLADALDAVLAGRSVATAETPVSGCLIDRASPGKVRPPSPVLRDAFRQVDSEGETIDVGPVTYAADVAPILQRRCQTCHRPGQVGPFSLLSFDQARAHAAMIREVVDARRMPPWHADPRYGTFANDRSLSPRERATLLSWVDQGAPPGDLDKQPAPLAFPEGWSIGTPDVVLEMAEPFAVPAEGVLPYQRFRVPTGFTEDKWVQAVEARPGDRAAVHHITVFIGEKDPIPFRGLRKGACLVLYAPGDLPAVYSEETAKRIPAGAELVFEVHYTPTGRPRSDRSSLGLIFAKGPVRHEAVTKGISQKNLRIPPGDPNHEVRSAYTFPDDCHLLSLMPHMHLRGKDFRYTLHYPDGRPPEVLLSVPAFDFGWQSAYRLAEPKAMPKGSRIECVAHFDNSAGNPNNPDPKATVTWGDYTWDEMMIGYIDYYHDGPTSASSRAHDSD